MKDVIAILNYCKEKGIKLKEVKPNTYLVPLENVGEIRKNVLGYET